MRPEWPPLTSKVRYLSDQKVLDPCKRMLHLGLANTLPAPGPILRMDVEVGADRRRTGASSAGALTMLGCSVTATHRIAAVEATVVYKAAIDLYL